MRTTPKVGEAGAAKVASVKHLGGRMKHFSQCWEEKIGV